MASNVRLLPAPFTITDALVGPKKQRTAVAILGHSPGTLASNMLNMPHKWTGFLRDKIPRGA